MADHGKNVGVKQPLSPVEPTPVVVKQPPDVAFYLDPENWDLIAVPKEDLAAFEEECRAFTEPALKAMAAKEAARAAAEEVERLRKVIAKAKNPDSRLHSAMEFALKRLDKASDKLEKEAEEQKRQAKKVAPAVDEKPSLMELVPLWKAVDQVGQGTFTPSKLKKGKNPVDLEETTTTTWKDGRTFAYVKRRNRGHGTYKIEGAEDPKEAFMTVAKDGKRKLDLPKLKKALEDMKPSGTLKKMKVKERAAWELQRRDLLIKALHWGYTMNEDDKARKVDLSAEAQFLRWSVGAAAYHSGLKDLRKGKISARVNGQAEFSLAEGHASGAYYFPNYSGVRLEHTFKKPGMPDYTLNMGAARFELKLDLAASVGASVVVELGIEVNASGKSQCLKGSHGGAATALTSVVSSTKGPTETLTGRSAEIKADADAFAGARASIALTGAAQWNPPETDDWKDFACVKYGVEAQAGIGAAFHMHVGFSNGKFTYSAKAALCFGIGCKGQVSFEVDAGMIKDFLLWLYHQLKASNFRILEYIDKDAFGAFVHLNYLAIRLGQEAEKFVANTAAQIANMVSRAIKGKMDQAAMVSSVLQHPERLLATPPETKGMILAELADHNFWTRFDQLLGLRQQAVITVLRSLQSWRDWENTLEHLSTDFRKKSDAAASEAYLRDFLTTGIEFGIFERQFDTIKETLKPRNTGAPGWRPVMNTTVDEAGDMCIAPAFGQQRDNAHPSFDFCYALTQ